MKKLILIAGLILSVNTLASSVGESGKPECEYINQSVKGQSLVQSFDEETNKPKSNSSSSTER